MPLSDLDTATVIHSIGQLSGAVQSMQQGVFARIDDIKSDIRRLEESQSQRMTQLEDRVGKRIDVLDTRVTALEVEDKRLIDRTSRLSAVSGGLGGSVGGALAAGLVELLKRI